MHFFYFIRQQLPLPYRIQFVYKLGFWASLVENTTRPVLIQIKPNISWLYDIWLVLLFFIRSKLFGCFTRNYEEVKQRKLRTAIEQRNNVRYCVESEDMNQTDSFSRAVNLSFVHPEPLLIDAQLFNRAIKMQE